MRCDTRHVRKAEQGMATRKPGCKKAVRHLLLWEPLAGSAARRARARQASLTLLSVNDACSGVRVSSARHSNATSRAAARSVSCGYSGSGVSDTFLEPGVFTGSCRAGGVGGGLWEQRRAKACSGIETQAGRREREGAGQRRLLQGAACTAASAFRSPWPGGRAPWTPGSAGRGGSAAPPLGPAAARGSPGCPAAPPAAWRVPRRALSRRGSWARRRPRPAAAGWGSSPCPAGLCSCWKRRKQQKLRGRGPSARKTGNACERRPWTRQICYAFGVRVLFSSCS